MGDSAHVELEGGVMAVPPVITAEQGTEEQSAICGLLDDIERIEKRNHYWWCRSIGTFGSNSLEVAVCYPEILWNYGIMENLLFGKTRSCTFFPPYIRVYGHIDRSPWKLWESR